MVRIAALQGHPEFVGRNALIERRLARVLFDSAEGHAIST
jgi:hypothetical protein